MMKQLTAFCVATILCLNASPVTNAQGNSEATNLARQGSEAAKGSDWTKAIEFFRKAEIGRAHV